MTLDVITMIYVGNSDNIVVVSIPINASSTFRLARRSDLPPKKYKKILVQYSKM